MTQQGHIETQQHEQDFAYVDSLITGHTKPFVQMPSAQIEEDTYKDSGVQWLGEIRSIEHDTDGLLDEIMK